MYSNCFTPLRWKWVPGHFVALSIKIQIVKSPNRLLWRSMWYVFATCWGSNCKALRSFANKRCIRKTFFYVPESSRYTVCKTCKYGMCTFAAPWPSNEGVGLSAERYRVRTPVWTICVFSLSNYLLQLLHSTQVKIGRYLPVWKRRLSENKMQNRHTGACCVLCCINCLLLAGGVIFKVIWAWQCHG